MKRHKYLLFILTLTAGLFLAAFDAPALVNSSLTEQTGGTDVSLERNSSYRIVGTITPQVPLDIQAIDISCKRRTDTFDNAVLTDRINTIPGMITWETSAVNVDFDEQEGWMTAQYVKANTVGDDWSALAQDYVLYYIDLKVKRDAPLGASNVNYTADATISGTGGTNIKGTFTDFNYIVVYDQTAPVTTPHPTAGYYNTDQTIALSVNEEPSTVYYSVGENANYVEYTSPIPISGEEGVCTEIDIWMKSVDIPFGSSQNWETPHSATYVIDKEDPSMSNFSAAPEVVGMGGTVSVSFDVSDCSGVLANDGKPNYVRLGGQDMAWVSGGDVGRFEYQRLIDGTEEDPPLVEVRVTDRAGNWAVQTVAGLVEFDLEGPGFEIFPSPDPVRLDQLVTVHSQANKDLSGERPTVTVGGETAGYSRDDGNLRDYYHLSLVTGRNWEASFAFLNPSEDWDEDGLPNWWESNFGLDPHSSVGNNGTLGNPAGDGWVNLAAYQFYDMTGELIDPTDALSGGQAIPLHKGWNLISYTVNTAWYKGASAPSVGDGIATVRIEGDSWANFFSAARFKNSASNLIAVQVRHPDGEWKYYGQFQPDWRNTLDYISPDEGLWINMAAADTLILKGSTSAGVKRVMPGAGGNYPAINLGSGWNLIGIMPRTKFYVEGRDHDADGPSDLVGETARTDVPAMLKAAFNLSNPDFEKIRAIQVMYPPPYGVKAYDSTIPARYQSLHFIQPGAGAWVRLKDGQTLTINYREPE